MPRTVVLAFLAAAVALAAVLPTESGDVFYSASGGQAGAVNAFGQRLWSVPGQLIASDAVGPCLAVASALYNGTAFLGTAVTLYTPDGRPIWSAVVGVNATALATNRVETAVGGVDGSLYVLLKTERWPAGRQQPRLRAGVHGQRNASGGHRRPG
ncbi:MAG: hypothetical protein ACO2PM_00495 [Pyrobaculum sp.]